MSSFFLKIVLYFKFYFVLFKAGLPHTQATYKVTKERELDSWDYKNLEFDEFWIKPGILSKVH